LEIDDQFGNRGTFETIVDSAVDHGALETLTMRFVPHRRTDDWRDLLTSLRDGCLGRTRLVANNNGSDGNSEANTTHVALKSFSLRANVPYNGREKLLRCMSEGGVYEPLTRDLIAIVASNHRSLKAIQIEYELLSGLGREQLLEAVTERNGNLLSLNSTEPDTPHRTRVREVETDEDFHSNNTIQEAINQSLELNRRYNLYVGNLLRAQRPSQLLGNGNEIPLVVLSIVFREFGETKPLLFRSFLFEALRSAPIGFLNSVNVWGGRNDG